MPKSVTATFRHGIDVHTKGKRAIMTRLKALAGTVSVEDAGVYHEDQGYSQVYVETDMTESQLDHWLWKNNLGYIGTFPDSREKGAI